MKDFPKITYMLIEDILQTYFNGKEPLYFGEPTVCKCGYEANTLAGVGIHMRKAHNIYTPRGKRKASIYHTKEMLPGGARELK